MDGVGVPPPVVKQADDVVVPVVSGIPPKLCWVEAKVIKVFTHNKQKWVTAQQEHPKKKISAPLARICTAVTKRLFELGNVKKNTSTKLAGLASDSSQSKRPHPNPNPQP